MSDNRNRYKYPYAQSGNRGVKREWNSNNRSNQDHKRPKLNQSIRHPTDAASHLCTIDHPNQTECPLPSRVFTLVLENLVLTDRIGSVISEPSNLTTLVLKKLNFLNPTIPEDLSRLLEHPNKLVQLEIKWVNLNKLQWTAMLEKIVLGNSLQCFKILGVNNDPSMLSSLLALPSLEEIYIDTCESSVELLKNFIFAPHLRTITTTYMDILPDHIEDICKECENLNRKPVLTWNIGDKKLDLTPSKVFNFQCRYFSRVVQSILQNNLLLVTESSNTTIETILEPLIGHEVQKKTINLLPASMLAVSFENDINAEFDIDSFKSSLVICKLSNDGGVMNKDSSESNDENGIQRSSSPFDIDHYGIPTIWKSFHHVEKNGYLVVVMKGLRKGEITEMEARMDAFFDAARVGLIFITDPTAKNEANIEINITGMDTSCHMSIWKKVGTNLQKEYGRFLQSSRMIDIFPNSQSYRTKKDIASILEQWYMLRANGEDANSYPRSKLKEQNLCSEVSAEDWIEDIQYFALHPPRTSLLEPFMEAEGPVTVFRYGQFSETLETKRAEALIKYATNRGHPNPLQLLVTMLLRYAAVFGNFRQYCCSYDLFQIVVNEGVSVEGFASSFNAQILISTPPPSSLHQLISQASDSDPSTSSNSSAMEILDPSKETWIPQFCSAYGDVDGPFGSIGSFFHQSFAGKYVMVHPPNVEPVLSEAVHFIEWQLSKHPCTFALLLPAWDDLPAQSIASNSKFLVRKERLDGNHYPSQNPYTGEAHPSSKKFDLFRFKHIAQQ